jgi:Lactate racemase N-terminal domain
MIFPRTFRVKQRMQGPRVPDIGRAVSESIRSLHLKARVRRGETVAVTAGSRGISNIAQIIQCVCDELKHSELRPFIVPAMGSHGGASAEDQTRLLAHYGITDAAMGCPIKSSMEVVKVGAITGSPVFCDKHAWEADHIVVVARIKAHTDFSHDLESGLFKMMAIGLGKQRGAESYHRAGHQYGYARIFPPAGMAILNTGHILCGVGIVENGYGETAEIAALDPEQFEDQEKRLLQRAKSWMAQLPFDALDVLIVDEMGKNISGNGMDPHVTGRASVQKPPTKPHVRNLFVRDLSPESEGNAIGIGAADMTTWRLVKKIDYDSMHINAITAGSCAGVKVPMAFACDRDAIRTALGMVGLTPPEQATLVRIKDTSHLIEFEASEGLLDEVRENHRLHIMSDPRDMAFDHQGNLSPS